MDMTSEERFVTQAASSSVFWSLIYRLLIHRLFRELPQPDQLSLLAELQEIVGEPT